MKHSTITTVMSLAWLALVVLSLFTGNSDHPGFYFALGASVFNSVMSGVLINLEKIGDKPNTVTFSSTNLLKENN